MEMSMDASYFCYEAWCEEEKAKGKRPEKAGKGPKLSPKVTCAKESEGACEMSVFTTPPSL